MFSPRLLPAVQREDLLTPCLTAGCSNAATSDLNDLCVLCTQHGTGCHRSRPVLHNRYHHLSPVASFFRNDACQLCVNEKPHEANSIHDLRVGDVIIIRRPGKEFDGVSGKVIMLDAKTGKCWIERGGGEPPLMLVLVH